MVELFGGEFFRRLSRCSLPSFQKRLFASKDCVWIFKKNYSFYPPSSLSFFFSFPRLLKYPFECSQFEKGRNLIMQAWKRIRNFSKFLRVYLKLLDSRLFRNVGRNSRFGRVNSSLCLPYTTITNLSKFHPRSGDCIWIERATHRRNTALFVTKRQNLRRCVLPFTCPQKSQRSLPKRSRFSHTIDFYFLWIIVTVDVAGHQLRFTTWAQLLFFQISMSYFPVTT